MVRLTKQEKQDIIRFLEADKPLPEKYRFLLFEDKREFELVWNGKTNNVCDIVLPFQTIEHVDEPREENIKEDAALSSLFPMDERGRQLKGWTNKLIWGNNNFILSSLKNGPLRQLIENEGGIKLIYIDPPFDVGADFSMAVDIGDSEFTKKPNILEEIAYRDTWGRGADSFLAMFYERILLMRDLLSANGSIFVHCDWRLSSVLRLCLDEVFGKENFRNEIIWGYTGPTNSKTQQFPRKHDTILWYSKGSDWIFNSDDIRIPYKHGKPHAQGKRTWKEDFDKLAGQRGKVVESYWTDIAIAVRSKLENTGYPTQKPLKLLERIIKATSNEGDIVADFFCGSGTTAVASEKLGRKWIAADLGKFAIHQTRKRLIEVQRQLKSEGNNYRSFEVLNLGKYQRQHFVQTNMNLKGVLSGQQREYKESEFIDLLLSCYNSAPITGFSCFQGKKSDRFIAIGPIDIPVSRLYVEKIIEESLKHKITKVDILGFEFEMGMFPKLLEEAKNKGVDIAPKFIPMDVFDKRAVEANEVVFHDMAYIDVKTHMKDNSVAVELIGFSVYFSQDRIADAEKELKKNRHKIVLEDGQFVKLEMNEEGAITRSNLTKKWSDWIDYWSVDFDFESKQEVVQLQDPDTGKWTEKWTGDYIFENEWQSFRTKKNRDLEYKSVYHKCNTGRRKIAVKVVDILGNDTIKIVDVNVEKV